MRQNGSKAIHVIGASLVVVLLAGLLAGRLLGYDGVSRQDLERPFVKVNVATAVVPAPPEVSIADLEVPCWACREAKEWSIDFKTDLDILAPLGRGPRNAAVWFKDFTKFTGSRYEEAAAAMERRQPHDSPLKLVMPPDDPLLLEAEPWVDQATMRYYPDFFELDGSRTVVPNLLLQLNLAKGWVARGQASESVEKALEDYRRAIRLGRLLRQENVTVIADLVGQACIRYGAEAIFQHAVQSGDTELALKASVVLGETAPQRILTSARITEMDVRPYVVRPSEGGVRLELPESVLDELIRKARELPDRRFKGEAFMSLTLVRFIGSSPQQKEKVESVLKQLRSDPDPIIADTARWCLEETPSKQFIEEWTAPPK